MTNLVHFEPEWLAKTDYKYHTMSQKKVWNEMKVQWFKVRSKTD